MNEQSPNSEQQLMRAPIRLSFGNSQTIRDEHINTDSFSPVEQNRWNRLTKTDAEGGFTFSVQDLYDATSQQSLTLMAESHRDPQNESGIDPDPAAEYIQGVDNLLYKVKQQVDNQAAYVPMISSSVKLAIKDNTAESLNRLQFSALATEVLDDQVQTIQSVFAWYSKLRSDYTSLDDFLGNNKFASNAIGIIKSAHSLCTEYSQLNENVRLNLILNMESDIREDLLKLKETVEPQTNMIVDTRDSVVKTFQSQAYLDEALGYKPPKEK